MILLLSAPNDYSTSKVIRWLYHLEQEFIRIGGDTTIMVSPLVLGDNSTQALNLTGQQITLDQITAYWYRRGFLKVKSGIKDSLSNSDALDRQLYKARSQELAIVETYLHKVLNEKKSLGSFQQRGMNKLIALHQAQACGLRIPETMITSQKAELLKFRDQHQSLIVKPIFEMPLLKHDRYHLMTYTTLVKEEVYDQLEESFFPSLFQEAIPKKYELRVFYLDGKCYANAIFSQMSEQSAIDSRRYNYQKPNRRVPYQLPAKIHQQIQAFMESIELNCGSIDMIYSQNKEFVFLEVNPIGQFGMTSYLGNYRLEQKIAQYLAHA